MAHFCTTVYSLCPQYFIRCGKFLLVGTNYPNQMLDLDFSSLWESMSPIDNHRSLSMYLIFCRSGGLCVISSRAQLISTSSSSHNCPKSVCLLIDDLGLSLSLGHSKLNFINIILLVRIQLWRTKSAAAVLGRKWCIIYRLLRKPQNCPKDSRHDSKLRRQMHQDEFPKPHGPTRLPWSESCFCWISTNSKANTSALSASAQTMLHALPLPQLTQFWIQVLSACDWRSLNHIQNP